MFIPIFVLVLILWIVIARCLLLLVKYERRKKIWRWFLIATLFICTADQIAGMAYAHIWVAMAQGKSSMTVHTDELVAYQYVVGNTKFFYTAKPDLKRPEAWFGYRGYRKYQGILPTEYDSDDLSSNSYEFELTSNAKDPDCKLFYGLPKNEAEGRKSWQENKTSNPFRTQENLLKSLSKNMRYGDAVKCIAARPIPKISAKYLVKEVRIAPDPPEFPMGPYEYEYTKIVDLNNGRILCENRRVVFWSGWVFRYFFIDTEGSGKPPSYLVEKRGYCSVEPAHGSTYQTEFNFQHN